LSALDCLTPSVEPSVEPRIDPSIADFHRRVRVADLSAIRVFRRVIVRLLRSVAQRAAVGVPVSLLDRPFKKLRGMTP
jgi:hypothetical protein